MGLQGARDWNMYNSQRVPPGMCKPIHGGVDGCTFLVLDLNLEVYRKTWQAKSSLFTSKHDAPVCAYDTAHGGNSVYTLNKNNTHSKADPMAYEMYLKQWSCWDNCWERIKDAHVDKRDTKILLWVNTQNDREKGFKESAMILYMTSMWRVENRGTKTSPHEHETPDCQVHLFLIIKQFLSDN